MREFSRRSGSSRRAGGEQESPSNFVFSRKDGSDLLTPTRLRTGNTTVVYEQGSTTVKLDIHTPTAARLQVASKGTFVEHLWRFGGEHVGLTVSEHGWEDRDQRKIVPDLFFGDDLRSLEGPGVRVVYASSSAAEGVADAPQVNITRRNRNPVLVKA